MRDKLKPDFAMVTHTYYMSDSSGSVMVSISLDNVQFQTNLFIELFRGTGTISLEHTGYAFSYLME